VIGDLMQAPRDGSSIRGLAEPGPAEAAPPRVACRFCGSALEHTFVDLGMSPLCESYLRRDELDRMEPFYPLHVRICAECLLVQLPEYVAPERIFREYAYFSSYSDSWVEHARRYADAMVDALGLGPGSLVVELASNDGYLLQHFVARGVPVLGIEPAENVARAGRARGVPAITEFFGVELAEALAAEGRRADLLAANNVVAHVPDINDFVGGMAVLLAEEGLVTAEFPHVVRLIEGNQFDTIYHEHFSYLSFHTVSAVFAAHGLTVFDVEELPTHGGSIRIHARHAASAPARTARAERLLQAERAGGYDRLEGYLGFEERVRAIKRDLLTFLMDARREGRSVAGYGAPGKGNTLLNYCGIRTDLLEYTVDRNPYKHGLFLPGTHIPIHAPERIRETKPNDILILPWNLREEIAGQLAYVREWGGRLVVPIPRLETVS
jgi:SAM-dependent methyltransferase